MYEIWTICTSYQFNPRTLLVHSFGKLRLTASKAFCKHVERLFAHLLPHDHANVRRLQILRLRVLVHAILDRSEQRYEATVGECLGDRCLAPGKSNANHDKTVYEVGRKIFGASICFLGVDLLKWCNFLFRVVVTARRIQSVTL